MCQAERGCLGAHPRAHVERRQGSRDDFTFRSSINRCCTTVLSAPVEAGAQIHVAPVTPQGTQDVHRVCPYSTRTAVPPAPRMDTQDGSPVEMEHQDVDAEMSSVPASGSSTPLSSKDQEKVTRILAACREHDLDALSELASSPGGFIEDEVRRTACRYHENLLLLSAAR